MDIIGGIKRRVVPLREVMSARDYYATTRMPAFTQGSATVAGHRVAFSNAIGFLHSVREIFVEEVYAFETTTARPRIIDAGANIGLSVLFFKRRFPNSVITAYEPDAKICGLLHTNVAGLNDVDVHQSAAWIADTELTFFSEGSLAGSSEVDMGPGGQSVQVKAERLKDRLHVPVDFLKIDVEGAENAIIFDIEDALSNVENLFFEYHSIPGKPQLLGEMLALVTRAGYRYVLNGFHGPRLPFVDRVDHGFDLQANVSCFRVR